MKPTRQQQQEAHEAARKQKLELRERQRASVAKAISGLKNNERNILARVENEIGPLLSWPHAEATLMLKDHIVMAERFRLTLFLLGNGLNPTTLAEWMITRRMLRDDSARNHICSMLDAHRTGKLEAKQYTTYVMLAGMPPSKEFPYGSLATKAKDRVMVVAKPNFADLPECLHFWENAKRMLKRNSVYA